MRVAGIFTRPRQTLKKSVKKQSGMGLHIHEVRSRERMQGMETYLDLKTARKVLGPGWGWKGIWESSWGWCPESVCWSDESGWVCDLWVGSDCV